MPSAWGEKRSRFRKQDRGGGGHGGAGKKEEEEEEEEEKEQGGKSQGDERTTGVQKRMKGCRGDPPRTT